LWVKVDSLAGGDPACPEAQLTTGTIALLIVGFITWVASLAWVVEVFVLLVLLRREHAEEHRRILSPLPWTWTALLNPIAIAKIFVFVLRRGEEAFGNAKLDSIARRMRTTLVVVACGYGGILVLLVALGPSVFAA
jgi:hypothetical protein